MKTPSDDFASKYKQSGGWGAKALPQLGQTFPFLRALKKTKKIRGLGRFGVK
ncbi:hypothetical protein LAC03_15000 [Levilactobacillus acidifarinae]|nr:hypothetical protein LAC03_15000 [Levilactobacillus acidifarinae]